MTSPRFIVDTVDELIAERMRDGLTAREAATELLSAVAKVIARRAGEELHGEIAAQLAAVMAPRKSKRRR